MKLTNGPLPKKYPDWMSFYRDIKKQGLSEEVSIIKSPDFNDFDFQIYEFDLWYIKNKCFDEISESQNELTINEIDQILRALHGYHNGLLVMDLQNRLQQKLSEKIELMYKFANY